MAKVKRSGFANRLKGKGWKPDLPSLKDWKFSLHSNAAMHGPLTRPTESTDRRARAQNQPVMDQGNLGSCVGCSATAAVGFLRRTDRDSYSTIYSALQAYYDARIRDGMQWKDIDAGAYIRDAMDALRTVGVAPNSNWPYRISKFAVTPTAAVYKAAQSWKLGAHYRCETLDDILNAIAAGYAVVGGISCYSSMFTVAVEDSGKIPMPKSTDRLEGGHALYFDRYTESERLIRFQNSWGKGWGDDGYGYLPFAYIRGDLADDFWAMQAESPETTPWKD
jgi:C1A family cysteine protease